MILDQIIISNSKKPTKKTENNSSIESPIRSIAKSISWRLFGTIDTVLIAWLVIGDVSLAFTIGSVELITKMILYFFHERLWNTIKWGKK